MKGDHWTARTLCGTCRARDWPRIGCRRCASETKREAKYLAHLAAKREATRIRNEAADALRTHGLAARLRELKAKNRRDAHA